MTREGTNLKRRKRKGKEDIEAKRVRREETKGR